MQSSARSVARACTGQHLLILRLPARPPHPLPAASRCFGQAVRRTGKVVTDGKDFARAYLAPYQLSNGARQSAWRSRAFWALMASGSAYGICRLWETHQSRMADPNSLRLPFLGVQGLSRHMLLVPCVVVLAFSSCAFTIWRLFGSALGFGLGGGRPMPLRGVVAFLRLFVDKPGLGAASVNFSRPLLSPLGAAFSHRSVGHFIVNQFVLFGACISCIGKLCPGEFVSFFVSAAYFSSLSSTLAMTLTNRFVYSLGASGVISALVAFNVLTVDEDRRIWMVPENEPEQPSLALLGILPLPAWVTPGGGLAAWAAAEFACWSAAVWRSRLPRLNHAAHLGGIAFGTAYALWGHAALWSAHPVPPLKGRSGSA